MNDLDNGQAQMLPWEDRDGFIEDIDAISGGSKTFDSALIVHGIFASIVVLFGIYICCKVMLPQNRFERNTNLTIFYMAAVVYLFISCLPHGMHGIPK